MPDPGTLSNKPLIFVMFPFPLGAPPLFAVLACDFTYTFKNGNPVILDRTLCSDYNTPEKHHIFPNALLSKQRVKRRHLLPNFAFIPAELNKEISASRPSDYFKKYKMENPQFDDVLHSHLIPSGQDSPIWTDDFEGFVKARSILIFREIEKVVGRITPLELELEQNPVAVIDKLETGLRSHIDAILTEEHGDDYWNCIPEGTREQVKKLLAERARRHPYEVTDALTNYQRLAFCHIMDYAQLIMKNWQQFEPLFGSRGEVERHFLNVKEYRNALKHAREMNVVERKQGEASVEWLFRIIAKRPAVDEQLVVEDGSEGNATGEDAKSKPATLDELLGKVKDSRTLARIKELVEFCEAFPNVERYTTMRRVVYRTTVAFAKIYPRQYQFWVTVRRAGINDPHNLLLQHRHPIHGRIKVTNDLTLERVKDLIKQSHDSTLARVGASAN